MVRLQLVLYLEWNYTCFFLFSLDMDKSALFYAVNSITLNQNFPFIFLDSTEVKLSEVDYLNYVQKDCRWPCMGLAMLQMLYEVFFVSECKIGIRIDIQMWICKRFDYKQKREIVMLLCLLRQMQITGEWWHKIRTGKEARRAKMKNEMASTWNERRSRTKATVGHRVTLTSNDAPSSQLFKSIEQ